MGAITIDRRGALSVTTGGGGGPPLTGYAAEVMADGPSLYLRLGESAGTTAEDISGNNRDGTYAGGVTLAQTGLLVGDPDTAVDLNGSTGRITTSYVPFVNGTTRTFEGWANRDASADFDTLWGDNWFETMLRLESGSNDVKFRTISSSGDTTWTNAWPGNAQVVYWALVFNESADTAELFINGSSVGSQSHTDAWSTGIPAGNGFTLGRQSDSFHYFDGKQDEVAVYEFGLSSARIAAHYAAGT